jgi:hypothetical protein
MYGIVASKISHQLNAPSICSLFLAKQINLGEEDFETQILHACRLFVCHSSRDISVGKGAD